VESPPLRPTGFAKCALFARAIPYDSNFGSVFDWGFQKSREARSVGTKRMQATSNVEIDRKALFVPAAALAARRAQSACAKSSGSS
jgi:hypothetical protein